MAGIDQIRKKFLAFIRLLGYQLVQYDTQIGTINLEPGQIAFLIEEGKREHKLRVNVYDGSFINELYASMVENFKMVDLSIKDPKFKLTELNPEFNGVEKVRIAAKEIELHHRNDLAINLSVLILEGNITLHDRSLANLDSLKSLYIRGELHLDESCFNQLHNLRRLIINGEIRTPLHYLSADWIVGKSTELYDDHEIISLSSILVGMPKLEMIRLQVKSSTFKLPDTAFVNLTNLKNIDLIIDTLTSIDYGLISNLDKLQSLFISTSQRLRVKFDYRNGTNLPIEKLYITAKQLQLRKGSFSKLTNLKDLEIYTYTALVLDNNTFSTLSVLEELYIGSQKVVGLVSHPFEELASLRYLSLQACELDFVPEDLFENLVKLEYLDLSSNILTDLPEQLFRNQRQLKRVFLQYNQLETLKPKLFSNCEIEELNLHGNKLNHLSREFFANIRSCRELDLAYNWLEELPIDLISARLVTVGNLLPTDVQ